MQIATASYMSFAHGANDCANAIGPLAAAIQVIRDPSVVPQKIAIPAWLLAFGGAGIVLGLGTYGYKVIKTIGKQITEITPTRGFAADFGTATTVLVFSKLGMPISTTFVIVGAVMGVGLARGFAALDLAVIKRIFASWIVTIPISAGLAMVAYWVLMALVG
jgi:PiT family inorganic phosphate transporter